MDGDLGTNSWATQLHCAYIGEEYSDFLNDVKQPFTSAGGCQLRYAYLRFVQLYVLKTFTDQAKALNVIFHSIMGLQSIPTVFVVVVMMSRLLMMNVVADLQGACRTRRTQGVPEQLSSKGI
jgi:hypothetical protein